MESIPHSSSQLKIVFRVCVLVKPVQAENDKTREGKNRKFCGELSRNLWRAVLLFICSKKACGTATRGTKALRKN